MIIVGVAGTNGSGKDTLGDLLSVEFDFTTVSLSDILRAELDKLGMPHTRENLSNHSKRLRDSEGDGAMAVRALTTHRYSTHRLCLTSIRTPGEVDTVHQAGGIVFWIDADPKIRYARITSRAGIRAATDLLSYEEFLQQQEAEMKPSKQGGGLHMDGVREKADRVIRNEFPDVEVYKEHLRRIVKEHVLYTNQ